MALVPMGRQALSARPVQLAFLVPVDLDARRAEVARLRTVEKLSHREIAERLDVSRAVVTRDLNMTGLRGYTPGADERRAEVVRLFGEGLKAEEIAERLGCSQSTVVRDRHIAGAPGPRPIRPTGYTVTCPQCGWEGGKDWASIGERYMHVAAKAIKLASVPGADPVDALMEAASVEHHTDPALVRNRARWLLNGSP